MPQTYAEYAPERVRLPNGGDAFRVRGGGREQKGGMNLYSGSTPEDYWPGSQRWEDCPGTGLPPQRLREQDIDGIDAEVLYPGPGSRGLLTGHTDPRVSQVLVRAYNDYLGQEYCPQAPDRLIGLGIIPEKAPGSLVDAAIAEMEYCKRDQQPHLVHRLPPHRVRLAQFHDSRRRDLRRSARGGEIQDGGRQLHPLLPPGC